MVRLRTLAVFGLGYVFGTRAGRERFEEWRGLYGGLATSAPVHTTRERITAIASPAMDRLQERLAGRDGAGEGGSDGDAGATGDAGDAGEDAGSAPDEDHGEAGADDGETDQDDGETDQDDGETDEGGSDDDGSVKPDLAPGPGAADNRAYE